MNAKKTETTAKAGSKTTYSLTAITALEFETICKGLELVRDQISDAAGCRAMNMLARLDGLREGAADNGH